MHCIGGILTGAGLEDIEKFGHIFIAVDIGTFSDPDLFKSEVETKLKTIRNAKRSPGVDRIYYPVSRNGSSETYTSLKVSRCLNAISRK